MICVYAGNDTGGMPCHRVAVNGRTTCKRHFTAGHSTPPRNGRAELANLKSEVARLEGLVSRAIREKGFTP